jgi:Mn-dependent DtxR family transcriptional regulator
VFIYTTFYFDIYTTLIFPVGPHFAMSLTVSDLAVIICMFQKGAIQARHYPVEAIAKKCHVKTKKALKKQLIHLTQLGYVERHKPNSFSLSPAGRQLAQDSI